MSQQLFYCAVQQWQQDAARSSHFVWDLHGAVAVMTRAVIY